jgi:iron complex transport system substrate-binding protein
MQRRLILKGLIASASGALTQFPIALAAHQEGQQLSSAAFPLRMNDALGRSLRISRAPERIVVVFPSNVEIAYALGLESRIVAIGGRTSWPPAARMKPSVGGPLGYSAEVVASFKPDLIVVTPSHMTALGLINPFERIGIPVLVLQHPDLPSIFRNIGLLGEATGAEIAAKDLIEAMQTQLNMIRQRLQGAPVRRVFLETGLAGNANLQTIGSDHYAHDALHWAGGANIFPDLKGAQQVSSEAVFLRDPDVIISLQQTGDTATASRLIAQRPGWHTLRAVRTGRVVVLPRGHKLIPGPRQIDAVADYAQAIHPEKFNS